MLSIIISALAVPGVKREQSNLFIIVTISLCSVETELDVIDVHNFATIEET